MSPLGALSIAAALAIAGAMGWALSLKADLADCGKAHAEYVAKQEREAQEEAAKAVTETGQVITEVAAVDHQLVQELNHAKSNADQLRADLQSARQRLRDRFTCPPTAKGSDAAPAGGSKAPTGLLPEDAQFLVGVAGECDARIRVLQAYALICESRFGASGPQ